ncbi:tetratricopeptide repeat protein [Phenylobacterium sp. J367]|uniref:tetratricopeptide repeat protein n=1 Tax=Phenylobacterium sp. J367 TaxID=2898435 RepID=UPI0021510E35|nr:tetratricopeptide repeat protein [Phenylobacterium sp. J367]MCR5880060.1 tetratricopeptide repeat protein [Phenylobacterium sp. J367]
MNAFRLTLATAALIAAAGAARADDVADCRNEARPAAERLAACTKVADRTDASEGDRAYASGYRIGRLIADERYKESLEALEVVIKESPDSPDLLALRATVHYRMENYAPALRDAAAALRRDPANANALLIQGHVFYSSGRLEAAEAGYRALLKVAPDDPAGQEGLATVLSELGRGEEAMPQIEAILKRPNAPAVVWYQRAAVLSGQEEYDRAIADLDRAIALDPKDPRFHYLRGDTLYAKDDAKGALVDFDAGLALVPKDPDLLAARGIALRALDREDEALAALAAALEAAPGHQTSLLVRSQIWRARGEPEKAVSDLKIALAADPSSAFLHNAMGVGYEAAGDLPAAEREFSETLKLDKANIDAYAQRGRVRAARGDTKGALCGLPGRAEGRSRGRFRAAATCPDVPRGGAGRSGRGGYRSSAEG